MTMTDAQITAAKDYPPHRPPRTVLEGLEHPGTPLRILQSVNGYFLGFLTKIDAEGNGGEFYSRESVHFPDQMGAAGNLDLIQMQSMPFAFMVKPHYTVLPESTLQYLDRLTAGGGCPVRQETESSSEFKAPFVEEMVSLLQAAPEDPVVRNVLTDQATKLGIDVTEDMTIGDIADEIAEATEAADLAIAKAQTANAEAVTPPADTGDDTDEEEEPVKLPGE